MVRACRPRAREPGNSGPGRRSTTTASTPARASSPASISPVGPAPAITTGCSVTIIPATTQSRDTFVTGPDPGLTPFLSAAAQGGQTGLGLREQRGLAGTQG